MKTMKMKVVGVVSTVQVCVTTLLCCIVYLVAGATATSANDHPQNPLPPWYDPYTPFNPRGDTFTSELYRQLGEFVLQALPTSYLELGCGFGEAARRVVPIVSGLPGGKSVLVEKNQMADCKAAVLSGPTGISTSPARPTVSPPVPKGAFFLEGDLYSSTGASSLSPWNTIRQNAPYDFVLIHASHMEDRTFSDLVNVLQMVAEAEPVNEAPVNILVPDYGNTKNRDHAPNRINPGVKEAVDFFVEQGALENCRGFGFFYGSEVEEVEVGAARPERLRQAEALEAQKGAAPRTTSPGGTAGRGTLSRYKNELERGYYGHMDFWAEGWEAALCSTSAATLHKMVQSGPGGGEDVAGGDKDEKEKLNDVFTRWRLRNLRTRPATYLVYKQLTGYLFNLAFDAASELHPRGPGAAGAADLQPMRIEGEQEGAPPSEGAQVKVGENAEILREDGDAGVPARDTNFFLLTVDGASWKAGEVGGQRSELALQAGFHAVFSVGAGGVTKLLGALFDKYLRSVQLFDVETGAHFAFGMDFKELNNFVTKDLLGGGR